MGWLIAGVILLLILWTPVGAGVRYNSDGVTAKIVAGPVRIMLWPRKKKAEKPGYQKPKPKKEKKTKKEKPAAVPEQPKETGGSVRDFIPFVTLGLDFLRDLRRKLRVNKLELKILLAGDDPCDLAVSYGKTWAAVGNFLPLLEQFLVIGSRDIGVSCDFAGDQTTIIAGAEITITIGRALLLAVRYGVRGLREFIKFKNKRKGGAVK